MVGILDGFLQALGLLVSFNSEIYGIMFLSLFVSGMATIIASLMGVPLGALISLKRFRGKELVKTMTYTLMGLPPVVAGLVIFLIFVRIGPLGMFGLLYTPVVMIIAQITLATPIIVGVTISAVSSVPKDVRDTALSLGATEWQSTFTILKEARIGLITAIITGFGSCISEVGAVMIVGGNIRYETRVLTTSIMTSTGMGDFGYALALGIILLVLAFAVNVPLVRLQRRHSSEAYVSTKHVARAPGRRRRRPNLGDEVASMEEEK
ncbi:MAG: ABC transporter permease [Promethearchaeati archaeon SRVP18_Atabeyarchaeia-1]